ncbi:MAG: type VI secretion system baseplate subunit TssE, partial [Hyphomicrobiales bacterium]|nr:type VI secretion system baseplate subunit TssE [Hyphomicrobiales bacterium]
TQKNDRLAPPLMHAFRVAHQARDATRKVDIRDQGERVIASRRLKARAPIPETELRKAVNTELVALFNTTNLESIEDLSAAPEVRRSIINFGFPSLTRRTIDENETNGVAREIEIALRDFEPRLLAGSIKARRDDTVSPNELRVRFLVTAALRTQPVEVPVQFIAEVELDSGKIKLDRL